jgi:hypothetical protein
MTAVWPIALNDVAFEPQGFVEKWPDVVLRTQMEVGEAKQRRRFTSAPTPIEGTILIRDPDVPILYAFWDTTLGKGALRFEWVHPRTRTLATFRFTARPELGAQAGGAWWRITLKLELLA